MKLIRRALIGLGAGVLAFLAVYLLINMQDRSVNYQTESWQEPQLPVAYVQVADKRTNPMVGHRRQLPPGLTAADLALVGADETIHFQVQTNGGDIKDVRFKLYEMTTQAKEIEYSLVSQLQETEGVLQFAVQPSQALSEQQSYLLELELSQAEQTLYYYTRVEKRSQLVLDDYLTFVQRFFDSTLAGTELAQLSDQITYVNQATPTYCDMTTGETAILWGRKQPKLMQQPIPRLVQAGDHGLAVVQSYQVEHEGEAVQARELYRLNHEDGQVHLVHYERRMQGAVLSPESVEADHIELGLRQDAPGLTLSRDRKAVAVEKDGSIWSYHTQDGELNLIYGSGQATTPTAGEWAIRVQEVADDGSITFFVGGYMQSTLLEGRTGIAVYRYDHGTHVTKQLGFIDINAAGSIIAEQLKKFAYLNSKQEFFTVIEGQLYKADLQAGELYYMNQQDWQAVTESLSGVTVEDFAVSDSGRQFAVYQGIDANQAQSVDIYDLESGKQRIIKAAEGEWIKPGLFLEEDYVYGMAKAEDLLVDDKGKRLLGCYSLEVQDANGEVQSRYQKDHVYIGSWRVEDHAITLKGYSKADDYYVESMEDHIINNVGKEETKTSLKQRANGHWQLIFDSHLPDEVGQVAVPVQVGRDMLGLPLSLSGTQPGYMVFGRGELLTRTSSAGEAVRLAMAAHGRVEDAQRQTIWQRGEVEPLGVVMDAAALPTEEINAVLAGDRSSKLLPETVVDLSGAEVDSLYQFLSQKKPVIGINDWHEPVVVYGFDLQGLYVLKPADGSTELYSYEKAAQILGGDKRFWLLYNGK
ncbi:MAG: hypothetical protein Q4D52_00845 [Eubacteriales bacterium]|nr:hypothetical protein [Eubacteriales bacterium]